MSFSGEIFHWTPLLCFVPNIINSKPPTIIIPLNCSDYIYYTGLDKHLNSSLPMGQVTQIMLARTLSPLAQVLTLINNS